MHALISGQVARDPAQAAVSSPFSLGTLDIALASAVAEHTAGTGAGVVVDDFYAA